jgi:hypothetical protein
MYKGYQEELFSCSWGVNAGFKHLADKLNNLLPIEGKCANSRTTNKYLDKFRRAQNCAYDLFNNGLCNRRGEFRRMFDGYSPTPQGEISWDQAEKTVEEMLTPMILQAAKEQNIA